MKKLLISILIVSFCNALSYSQDVENIGINDLSLMINIDVKSLYTPTGVQLDVGDSVLIFADGVASSHMGYWWHGPEGIGYYNSPDNFPVPDLPVFSLMGKIGENGTPFYIGSSFGFSSNVSGEFFLGVNDYPHTDNVGYWIAWIICNTCSGTTTEINEINPQINNVDLNQNYPNPFSPETTIEFSTKKDGITKLEIYNVSGKKVSTLLNEFKPAGAYKIKWNGNDDFGNSVVAGTYFYTLEFNNKMISKKMILVK